MSNARLAYDRLVREGLRRNAAIGVIGNFVAESNVDPKAVQRGGPGRGIAQWSIGQRWTDCTNYCARNHLDLWSLDGQLTFAIHEMRAMGVWAHLATTNDGLNAACYVMRHFEMPKVQTDANGSHRYQMGLQAIGTYGAHSAPAPSPATHKYATVHSGDTLTSIARAHHTTVSVLLHLNPQIRNANLIHPGDKVRIP